MLNFRLMKQREAPSHDFLETIHKIEISINSNLMKKGGLGKLIFRDSNNKWFIVHKNWNRFEVEYLKYGFWRHFKDLFKDKRQIYESKDIFYGGATGRYNDVLSKLFQVLAHVGRRIPNNEFKFFHRDEYMWDLYALPFSVESLKELRASLLDSSESSISDRQYDSDLLVTHGIFISLNCIGRTNTLTYESGDGELSRRSSVNPNHFEISQSPTENISQVANPLT